jgi:hypothetical protein
MRGGTSNLPMRGDSLATQEPRRRHIVVLDVEGRDHARVAGDPSNHMRDAAEQLTAVGGRRTAGGWGW